MRPFVESTPLFAMGFCSLLSGIKKKSVEDLDDILHVAILVWRPSFRRNELETSFVDLV